MNGAPAVTVLMPVYNAARYVRGAVDSILAQSFRDFHFLIIDDGSTDDSRAILQSFDDPRIRLVCHPRNLGLVETLNHGLALACGEFVARMDADDQAFPDRLERQVACLRADPTIGLVATGVEIIDERCRRRLMVRNAPTSHNLICWNLLFENCITHSSVMMRRSVVRAVGGYTVGASAEDYDLWVRTSRLCQLVRLPTVLQRFRMNPEGTQVNYHHEYDEWNLRVMEKQVVQLLGRPVLRESLECLRRVSRFKPQPSGRAVTETGELILECFESFVNARGVTGRELSYLRTDAGARLLSLAGLSFWRFPIPALRLVNAVSRFGPRSIVHRYTFRGILCGIAGSEADAWLKRVLMRA